MQPIDAKMENASSVKNTKNCPFWKYNSELENLYIFQLGLQGVQYKSFWLKEGTIRMARKYTPCFN
jgi:hypothetical protein